MKPTKKSVKTAPKTQASRIEACTQSMETDLGDLRGHIAHLIECIQLLDSRLVEQYNLAGRIDALNKHVDMLNVRMGAQLDKFHIVMATAEAFDARLNTIFKR